MLSRAAVSQSLCVFPANAQPMCHNSSTAQSWAAPSSAVPGSVPEHPQRVLEPGLSALLGRQQRVSQCWVAPALGTLCQGDVRAPRALLGLCTPGPGGGSQHTVALVGLGQEGRSCDNQKNSSSTSIAPGLLWLAEQPGCRRGGWELGLGAQGEPPHLSVSPSSPSSAPAASKTSPSPKSAPLCQARRSSTWRRT